MMCALRLFTSHNLASLLARWRVNYAELITSLCQVLMSTMRATVGIKRSQLRTKVATTNSQPLEWNLAHFILIMKSIVTRANSTLYVFPKDSQHPRLISYAHVVSPKASLAGLMALYIIRSASGELIALDFLRMRSSNNLFAIARRSDQHIHSDFFAYNQP